MKRFISTSLLGLALASSLGSAARADDVKADVSDRVDEKDNAKDDLHTDSGTKKAVRHVKKGARHVKTGARHAKEDVQDSAKN